MVKEPNVENSQQKGVDRDMTTHVNGSHKWLALATLALAIATAIMAGYTAKAADETARMAEVTAQTLEMNLLSQRFQYLHGKLELHRAQLELAFQQRIYALAEQTSGVPSGQALTNNEQLCSTLGENEFICKKYHEYVRIFHEAWTICNNIPTDMRSKEFEPVDKQLDELESKLSDMTRIYNEVFFPGQQHY